jgi:hypothetical protein
LEAVEAMRLHGLNFIRESFNKALVDDTIRSDEETFTVIQVVVPIMKVLGKDHLLCRPKGGFGLLVHLPDL